MNLDDHGYGATCAHLNNVGSNMFVIRAAAAIEFLKEIKKTNSDVDPSMFGENNVMCASCFRVGSLDTMGKHVDREFLYHSLQENHSFFVRVQEPYELFCMRCGDYSYSNLFDFLIKRNRTTDADGNSIQSLEEKIVATLGIPIECSHYTNLF